MNKNRFFLIAHIPFDLVFTYYYMQYQVIITQTVKKYNNNPKNRVVSVFCCRQLQYYD